MAGKNGWEPDQEYAACTTGFIDRQTAEKPKSAEEQNMRA